MRGVVLREAAQPLALLVLLLLSHAAAGLVQYDCPAANLSDAGGDCGPVCQRDTGQALLQLYASLLSGASLSPWQYVAPGAHCRTACPELPAYCSWQGVSCCHNATSVRARACQSRRAAACPDASAGHVWQLDMTMFRLAGRLDDAAMDALEVLASYGLHALDLSRCGVVGVGVARARLRVWVRVPHSTMHACRRAGHRRQPAAAAINDSLVAPAPVSATRWCARSNNITGTLPARLGDMGANLTTINLNFNSAWGLGALLCSGCCVRLRAGSGDRRQWQPSVTKYPAHARACVRAACSCM
jgi:hypothetical protein